MVASFHSSGSKIPKQIAVVYDELVRVYHLRLGTGGIPQVRHMRFKRVSKALNVVVLRAICWHQIVDLHGILNQDKHRHILLKCVSKKQ